MGKRPLSSPGALWREPLESRAWVQIVGSSMWPLLQSGDLLRVRRCGAEAVRRGDIVVVRHRNGGFMAHLASSGGAPIRTVGFHGRPDESDLELVAKVEAIHTRGVDLPLAPFSRHFIWGLHRLYATARVWRLAGNARAALRAAANSTIGAEVRRVKNGPFEVRLLDVSDTAVLVLFAGHHLEVPIDFLKRQLKLRWFKAGGAAGAFDRGGRLCGFAYFDEFRQEGLRVDGWWVRSLFVAPHVRRLGLGGELIRLLCHRARELGVDLLRADIPASNVASQALFRRESFEPSPRELVEQVASEWQRNGVRDEWAVLQRPP